MQTQNGTRKNQLVLQSISDNFSAECLQHWIYGHPATAAHRLATSINLSARIQKGKSDKKCFSFLNILFETAYAVIFTLRVEFKYGF